MNKTDLQKRVDQLCVLAQEKWPEEWPGIYRGSMEGFRDFLNQKTGLHCDHIQNKQLAITMWLNSIKMMP